MPPPTDTTTSVVAGRVVLPSSVAVTVTVVPDADSDTEVGEVVSVIDAGAVSSSVRVISALVTVNPVATPVTSMVSLPSAMLSFVGVSVNVPLPLAVSSGIVTVKSDTAVWSVPEVAVPPPTDTTTSVASGRVTLPSSVAVTVTVVPDADSDTEAGDTLSVIAVGVVSSSVRLISALVTVNPSAVPVMSMVSLPSAMVSWVGVSVNVPLPLAVCSGIVTVKSDTVV